MFNFKWIFVLALLIIGFNGSVKADLVIPSQKSFLQWFDEPDSVTSDISPATYPAQGVACADQNLYPAFPQQSLKQYHVFRWGQYDLNKVAGNDRVCVRAGGPTEHPHAFCVRSDILFYAVMSDVFEDSCGHLYRGFKDVTFLQTDETMGTLFSPGRTAYPDPQSQFTKSFVDGGTYAVPVAQFLKIGHPFSTDQTETLRLKQEALRAGFTYDLQTHLFIQN